MAADEPEDMDATGDQVLQQSDFVLVKFEVLGSGKRKMGAFSYACVVQNVIEDRDKEVMRLKSVDASKTTFRPDEKDITFINDGDIITKLCVPKVICVGDRMQYEFSEPIDVIEK
ncbi:hypothetical protein PR048_010646 [Dryococelus australis]|uniref:Uncharacterized protein n=1 Tax=Dryococelus australis TaxID=614101 RepID=A0ABQ9I3B5_9NEOP|nr:hypothetical protein PR048_010646 [Dryococelus australis]